MKCKSCCCVMLFNEHQRHHTNLRRTSILICIDITDTQEGSKCFLMQTNIVSLSEYNEMGIYATVHTVHIEAKLVDRQNL